MLSFGAVSCRDRTADFTAAAERLAREKGASTSSRPPAAPGSASTASALAAQQSEFSKRAAWIGQGIHATSQKLFQLSQLAKRTSMFDDPAHEIAELSSAIKQEIQNLNAGLADLQTVSAMSREPNTHSLNHSHTVVDNLRSRLKDTTKQFSDVLNLRKDNLKVHQGRRNLFSSPADQAADQRSNAGPSSRQQWQTPGQLQPMFAPVARQQSDDDAQAFTSERAPLLAQQGQAQSQQLALAQPSDAYLSSRAEALRNVESTIHDLGQIFNQLAVMVQEQGELAIRIDENIDDSLASVDSAQAQLLKYLNSISSNRWLIMKVFAVLVAFLIVFVVFVA